MGQRKNYKDRFLTSSATSMCLWSPAQSTMVTGALTKRYWFPCLAGRRARAGETMKTMDKIVGGGQGDKGWEWWWERGIGATLGGIEGGPWAFTVCIHSARSTSVRTYTVSPLADPSHTLPGAYISLYGHVHLCVQCLNSIILIRNQLGYMTKLIVVKQNRIRGVQIYA